jgi:hypothetical protein
MRRDTYAIGQIRFTTISGNLLTERTKPAKEEEEEKIVHSFNSMACRPLPHAVSRL